MAGRAFLFPMTLEFVRGNGLALRQYLGGVEPQVRLYGWE